MRDRRASDHGPLAVARAFAAARLANVPPGGVGKRLGATTDRKAALDAGINVSAVVSAKSIIRRGVPDLEAAVRAGAIALTMGRTLSLLPHADQLKYLARGFKRKTTQPAADPAPTPKDELPPRPAAPPPTKPAGGGGNTPTEERDPEPVIVELRGLIDLTASRRREIGELSRAARIGLALDFARALGIVPVDPVGTMRSSYGSSLLN